MIDINIADKKTLTELKGIGEKTAQNIIDYRENVQYFFKKEQIMEVTGIGKSLYEKIKHFITIDRQKFKKIEFNAEDFGLENKDIEEVHLVGEMNGWNPANKDYNLTFDPINNVWYGIFFLKKGTEYKIMYDSEDWHEGKHIGNIMNENFKI